MSDAELEQTLRDLSDAEAIQIFAESLLDEKGIKSDDEDAMKMMVEDLMERINDFLTQALVNALPEDGVMELDGMISLGVVTPSNMQSLLKRFKVNTEEVLGKALAEFREQYLSEQTEK